MGSNNFPKIIFQTYKENHFELCPDFMKSCSKTWIEKNSDYKYYYISDKEARKMIYKKYGKEKFELFYNVPVNVMKADIIRLIYLYEYGGVYADMDTVCNLPLSSWIDDSYDFLICPENDSYFAQWFFVSKKHNPIIKNNIDEIFKNLKNEKYLDIPHFVMGVTGPFSFTRNILNFYEINGIVNLNELNVIENKLLKTKIYEQGAFGGYEKQKENSNKYLTHLFGSRNWNQGYDQWILHKSSKNDYDDINLEDSFWNNWRNI